MEGFKAGWENGGKFHLIKIEHNCLVQEISTIFLAGDQSDKISRGL